MDDGLYRAYLLRLWREHTHAPLRVTLIMVAQPDQRQHFDTLEACFAFLQGQAALVAQIESVNLSDRDILHCIADGKE